MPHLNRNKSPMQCYKSNDQEKKRAYEKRVREIEHGSFAPLVFSISGGMGPIATTVYKRMASLIAEKHNHPYSSTLFWLRCKLSFSLLRSAIMCIRGSRSFYHRSTITCIRGSRSSYHRPTITCIRGSRSSYHRPTITCIRGSRSPYHRPTNMFSEAIDLSCSESRISN